MDAELPRVAEGADGLRLLREVVVAAVLHVALVDEGLEVGAVADAVGRVDVDHLHLAGHAFFFQQAVHDQQAVSGNEPVGPVVFVLVELNGLADGRILLRRGEQRELWLAVLLPYRFDDAARVDAFMYVQGNRRHLKGRVFGLPRPLQLRVQVRVVGVGLLAGVLVRVRCHQADRRVIYALLVGVGVGLNVFRGVFSRSRHVVLPVFSGLHFLYSAMRNCRTWLKTWWFKSQ